MLSAFAIMLPTLLLACGLCIDLAMLELCQVRMQTAADDAALSAAFQVERGTGDWATVGQQEASTYGFTDGSNKVTVAVAMGATSGAYQGRSDAMQVNITQSVKTIFMGTFNGGYTTVQAQAIALVTPCMYLLGKGILSPITYYAASGATNSYKICPISINGLMQVDSPSHVDVEAVNLRGSGAAVLGSGAILPAPNYSVTTFTDPLAYVTAPTFGGCTHISFSLSNGAVNLSPGTYCGGLNLIGATVTLSPGLYVITGGATWLSSTVTGDGVTLFFTQGGGFGFGQFQMNFSTVALSAPASSSNGAIAGIAVFADRNWTATAAQDFRIYYSTMVGDGIWYLPSAGFYVWNGGTVTGPHYFGLVADNYFQEGTNFNPRGDYSYVTTGNPFRTQEALIQ